ncbi:hypothetical protein ScalyP_jg409 [Parmales sp. scaly parma]|nr:hypothetical protein ScalyP_jg409 [Parmales sp. scaly parma]
MSFILLKRYPSSPTRRKIRYKSTNERVEKPPFPPELTKILKSSTLSYMSTTDGSSPHLSLMNFTYDDIRQQIIMTTRTDTLKAALLKQNPNVALLIHDFPTLRDNSAESSSYAKTFSITLYGSATFIDAGPEAEILREIHSQNNPNQSAFIHGDKVGVLVVNVVEARICDASDKVLAWRL